jgi:hypothetical protein
MNATKLMRSQSAMWGAAAIVIALGVGVVFLTGHNKTQPSAEGDVDLQSMGVPLANTSNNNTIPIVGTSGSQLQDGGASQNPQSASGGTSLGAASGSSTQSGSAFTTLQSAGTANPASLGTTPVTP